MISRPPQIFKSQIDDLIYSVWSVSISQNKYVLSQTFAQANLQAVTNYMLVSYFPLTLHQPSDIYGFRKNHKYYENFRIPFPFFKDKYECHK